MIEAKFGEKAYSKIRYFVVVREMQGCCLCLPLNTYSFQGMSKQKIRVEDYAAVYAVGSDPPTQDREALTKDPFPIIIEDTQETLSPMSRLNFGRVYTVEHNIKVLKFGRIPKEHIPALNRYFVESMTGAVVVGSADPTAISRNEATSSAAQGSSSVDTLANSFSSIAVLTTLPSSSTSYDTSYGTSYGLSAPYTSSYISSHAQQDVPQSLSQGLKYTILT